MTEEFCQRSDQYEKIYHTLALTAGFGFFWLQSKES